MFGLPEVPITELPLELMHTPRLDQCSKCGTLIIWTRRSDGDELGTPIEPHAATDGDLIIVGFTRSMRTSAIIPHVRNKKNIFDALDRDDFPDWARTGRWFHHAPFCKQRVKLEDSPVRIPTIDDDPELATSLQRRKAQSSRQRIIGALLQRVLLKIPKWTPGPVMQQALTQYELGNINSAGMRKAIMLSEDGKVVGDFMISENESRQKAEVARRLRRPLRQQS